MARKLADKSKGMIFTSGILAGLIFLLFVPRDVTGQLQLTYARVFRWPLAMGRNLTKVSQTTTRAQDVNPKDHEAVLKANQQLRNESANLQAQLQEANQQIEQLTKLRAKPAFERMRLVAASTATPGGH